MVKGIELFAGGGGLLLGSSLAGVEHVGAVEWDRWACDTLRENAAEHHPLVDGLQVTQGDVRDVDWSKIGEVDLITGGPPCQPFSLGGLARGALDQRDMFPAMTTAIAELAPRAFVVENVKGLTRSSFADYFELIRLRLQHPLVQARENESWRDHLRRLQRQHTRGTQDELRYEVTHTVVDAADYGVAQHRHRVFIVGFRSDQQALWNAPAATHSGAALRNSQESGEYWDRHRLIRRHGTSLHSAPGDPNLRPWRTVRDALAGLPRPGSTTVLNHESRPGAKVYPGHTGSPIDAPSKALKAGGHGVPGGENMIRFTDGSVRYYTVREAARIQGLPDNYRLHGAWGEAMRQIGNAVPVRLAEIMISSVVTQLEESALREHLASDTEVKNGASLERA